MSIYQELQDYIDGISIVNTHCHKLPKKEGFPGGLYELLENTYVSWCHRTPGTTKESMEAYVGALKHNSYFYWLERSLQELLGTKKRLDGETYLWFDERIREFSAGLSSDDRFFQEVCHYDKILEDAYWDPGSDLGNPGLYTPSCRINLFLFGYRMDVTDDNGNNPFQMYDWPKNLSFDGYLKAMEEKIQEKVQGGCVALKSSLPYDRSVQFQERTYEEAAKGYQNPQAGTQDIRAFQDFIYFRICEIAAKYKIPFQNHTGLGNLEGSNAMLLCEVIRKNPETKFVLFHGGFPWTDDVLALIHYFPNVYADLCWLPIISTTTAVYFIKQLIETGKADAITWGCDSWTVMESYGAYLAGRHAVARAIADLADDGFLTCEEGKELALKIFRTNALEIYPLTGA
ncbi:MAG: amidohydrolase family protein [Blautia sp.]|jgi:hypothetical protein